MARLYLPGKGSGNPAVDTFQRSALLKFRAARGLGTRRTKVAIVGDSVSRGQSTGAGTAQAVQSWPMQLAAQLQADGINAGANNVWGDGGSWGLGQTIANFLTGDSRVSVTGAWGLGSVKSAGGNAFSCTAAGSMTFTPQNPVTHFDIYWRDGSTGRNFTAAVDGGSTTAINSTGSSVAAKTTIAAGALGTHSLTLTWVLGSVNVIGIDAYDNTAGRNEISIQNWGICGIQAGPLLDNTDPAGRIALFNLYQPDLTIICPFINNWRNSTSLSQTQTDVAAIVTQAQVTGSAVLLTPPFDGGVAGLTAQQDAYSALAYTIGASQGAAVVDHRSTLGSYALGNAAGMYSDTVHQTKTGYADIARLNQTLIF
jgi:hypothetical protein